MSSITFRPFKTAADFEQQYALWLRATAGLPYAWHSNLTNTRAFGQHVHQQPDARLYAERDGQLVGYIGCHPPLDWEPGLRAAPFGYPWTDPYDESLAGELYTRMLTKFPTLFPDQPCHILVQRFRSSWTRQLDFMEARGWQRRWTYPILTTRTTGGPGACQTLIQPVRPADLDVVAALLAADPLAASLSREALQEQITEGWLELDGFWYVPDRGAFVLEVRRPYCEVKLFCAVNEPSARTEVLSAARAMARQRGASELYFTLAPERTELQGLLIEAGCDQADADIYVVRDAPQ